MKTRPPQNAIRIVTERRILGIAASMQANPFLLFRRLKWTSRAKLIAGVYDNFDPAIFLTPFRIVGAIKILVRRDGAALSKAVHEKTSDPRLRGSEARSERRWRAAR